MKIKFLADCHIGNPKTLGGQMNAGVNRRGEHVLAAFARAMQIESDVTVILGDLFDTDTPSPKLLSLVQGSIADPRYAQDTHIIVGNHDMTTSAWRHHACAPLNPVAFIHEKPAELYTANAHMVMVPYQAGPASEWLPGVLEDLLDGPCAPLRILCLHLGVSDDETAEYLKHAEDSISESLLFDLMREHHIDKAFVGNWHEAATWYAQDNKSIHQIGSTAPTGFNNPGFKDYGWVSVLDTDDLTVQNIAIPGPRFYKLDDSEPKKTGLMHSGKLTEEIQKQARDDDQVYISVDTRPSRHSSWLELIAEMKQRKVIQDGRVRSDKSVLDEASDAAAQEAIEADNVEDAIDGYVDAMTVSDGVQRKEVKRIVKEAL